MIHSNIKTKLLLYLDGSLAGGQMSEVAEHLTHCPHCSKELAMLSTIWKNETASEKLSPPHFLWTRLESRLTNSERSYAMGNIFTARILQGLRFSIAIIGLLIAFLIGNYLGNIPKTETQQDSASTSNGYIARSYHLDSFEPYPDGSIGQLFPLTSNQNK